VKAAAENLEGCYKRVAKQFAEDDQLEAAFKVQAEWDKLKPHATIVAVWSVTVGMNRTGTRAFYSNGHLDSPQGARIWMQNGATVLMRNVDATASEGLWEHACVLSADGKTMLGKNQRGERVELRRLK
jgi:hypothetical protein